MSASVTVRPFSGLVAVAVDSLFLETDTLGADVAALLHDERVEVRILSAPESRVRNRGRRLSATERPCRFSCRVIQRCRPIALYAGNRQFRPVAFSAFNIQLCLSLEVPYSVLRARPQRHVAEDAGEAEHVLVFEVAAVAPPVHLYGDEVLPVFPDVRRDVEFGRQLGILGIADEPAVHPNVESGADPLEAEDRVAPLPAFRQRERAPVG